VRDQASLQTEQAAQHAAVQGDKCLPHTLHLGIAGITPQGKLLLCRVKPYAPCHVMAKLASAAARAARRDPVFVASCRMCPTLQLRQRVGQQLVQQVVQGAPGQHQLGPQLLVMAVVAQDMGQQLPHAHLCAVTKGGARTGGVLGGPGCEWDGRHIHWIMSSGSTVIGCQSLRQNAARTATILSRGDRLLQTASITRHMTQHSA
jgi:hypothetical protein